MLTYTGNKWTCPPNRYPEADSDQILSKRKGAHDRARGVRKSPVEKLQGELADVQASIAQYESCLETMREKEKVLMEHIQLEEFKVVSDMLKERDMTMDDLKEMLAGGDVTLSA